MWARAALAAASILSAATACPFHFPPVVVGSAAEAVPFIPPRTVEEAKSANKFVAEQVNISRLANERQNVIAALAEFTLKQRLIQPFIEVEREFGREGVSRNDLCAQAACMQGKQIVHRRRDGQREDGARVIIHQDSRGATDIVEFEPDRFAETDRANVTIKRLTEFMSGYHGVKKRSLDSNQAVLGGFCSPFGRFGGPRSLSDRFLHVDRLLITDSPQSGSFRVQPASFRGQDSRKDNEGEGEGNRTNCGQGVDSVPVGGGPIRNRNEDAGPIVVYGTLAILTSTLCVIFITMRSIKKQETDRRKTNQSD